MLIPFIDLKSQHQTLQPQAKERVNGVYEHCQYIIGPEFKELEEKLRGSTGANCSLTVASGTEALLA